MTIKEAPSIIKNKQDRKNEWLDEVISYEFFNLEEPGVAVKFTFGPTNAPKTYTMLHGGKYNHPRRILQHIESRQTPIWGYKPNGQGQMQKDLKGYKSRFQCRQLFE
tara:strand:- start:329 stop:649 length:321 start_codon:yes stop_codon:yes gene_type:complete